MYIAFLNESKLLVLPTATSTSMQRFIPQTKYDNNGEGNIVRRLRRNKRRRGSSPDQCSRRSCTCTSCFCSFDSRSIHLSKSKSHIIQRFLNAYLTADTHHKVCD